MTRHKVELSHKLTVLHNWAFNPDKDTISALSENQAKALNNLLSMMWEVIERRTKR